VQDAVSGLWAAPERVEMRTSHVFTIDYCPHAPRPAMHWWTDAERYCVANPGVA
jgi:hypothetical protein